MAGLLGTGVVLGAGDEGGEVLGDRGGEVLGACDGGGEVLADVLEVGGKTEVGFRDNAG